MLSVPAALQDPRFEVTRVSLLSPWPVGRLVPFTCVNPVAKEEL